MDKENKQENIMKLKDMSRMLVSAMLCATLIVTPVQAASTDSSIDAAKEKQSEAKSNLDSKKGEISSLESAKSELDTYLTELNTQTAQLSEELSSLETQSLEKKAQLEQTQEELEEAKTTEEKQYEDMKKRIRFMYESSNTEYIDLLFGAESIADFLNKADNISQISAYDRNMLEEYQNTKDTIALKERTISEETDTLNQLVKDTEEKQGELNVAVSSISDKIKGYTNKIATAQVEASDYENTIVNQESIINDLIAQKEKEEQEKKAAEEKRQQEAQAEQARLEQEKAKAKETQSQPETTAPVKTPSTSNSSTTSGTGETSTPEKEKPTTGSSNTETTGGSSKPIASTDLTLLAALIECEAGGESYEGMLAVGAVVMNRVKSGRFPSSVSGVIWQSGQFTPASSGALALTLARGPRSICIQAAQEALNGASNVGDRLFFHVANGRDGLIIGNHVFY